MTDQCAYIFFALQRLLLVSVLTIVSRCCVIGPLIGTAFGCVFCLPCMVVGASAIGVGEAVQLVICIWGIFIVYGSTASETADCDSLCTCAWWVFGGSIFVTLVMPCCEESCKKKPDDRERERERLLEMMA
eukprot:TRINITY_DN1458_c1_g1_i1.p1 TRINITY_DN1458_c1_g1~~TRINITY_DN1458_c1_g1_i1.p1  ORF type:complete len:144 (-),score=13.00 TRINITY_DN1458_c1_g1_i1:43-435(-)